MFRSLGNTSLTRLPPIRTSPPEAGSRPAMIESRVDFPQPDGPSRTRKPPSSSSMSMLRRTVIAPKLLRTPLRVSAAIPSSLHVTGGDAGDHDPLDDGEHHDDRHDRDHAAGRKQAPGQLE